LIGRERILLSNLNPFVPCPLSYRPFLNHSFRSNVSGPTKWNSKRAG
jgi:hypothetical protein